jgi:DNA-binding PadR family transcriptional regulator
MGTSRWQDATTAVDVAEREDGRDEDSRLPELAYVVLGHVRMYPEGIHGYRLGRMLAAPAAMLPGVQLGQLYRLLRRLKAAGMVASRVEAESARLRYRYVITPRGETCLEAWLRRVPRGTGATCQQLLNRLRFAGALAPGVLRTLVDDAVHECRRNLELLPPVPSVGRDRRHDGAYEVALRARLATDLCWLEEVRGLVEPPTEARAVRLAAGARR